MAKQGLHLPVSDLFGVRGRAELAQARLDPAFRARLDSLCRVVEALDFEIDTLARRLAADLTRDDGYQAI